MMPRDLALDTIPALEKWTWPQYTVDAEAMYKISNFARNARDWFDQFTVREFVGEETGGTDSGEAGDNPRTS